MIKELKYLIYLICIISFYITICKHYLSNDYKKNTYRSLSLVDKKIKLYVKKLPYLKNDTVNIVEFIDDETDPKKKNFFFWKLLESNEK